jgi:hypothetical protein
MQATVAFAVRKNKAKAHIIFTHAHLHVTTSFLANPSSLVG